MTFTFDLEDNLKSPKSYEKDIFLALLVKNHIFAHLTLKLTYWPWKWLLIIVEIDYLSIYVY